MPKSIETVPERIRVQKGFLKAPPEYKEGLYNNQYIDLYSEEMNIYKVKSQRDDLTFNKMYKMLVKAMEADKYFVQRLKKQLRKKYDDVGKFEFFYNIIENQEESKSQQIDLNYFSKYIPEIGFRFTIDSMYN